MITLKGSCLCGVVKYEVTGEPARFMHCHCSRCRKATGTGHASNLFFEPGTVTWLTGDTHVRAFKVPTALRFTNQFCDTCGGRLPVQRQVGEVKVAMVPAGSLDDDSPITPQARIFASSRASWSCEGDALPVYPERPPQ